MSDREKVIKRLEECLSASCRGFRTCPYDDDPAWDAVEAALVLLREQEPREKPPRVLSLDEVKALGDKERTREFTTDIAPVWVEERSGLQKRIEIGLVWYDSFNEEWMGKDEWTICVKRFGTDYDTVLSVLDYGKTWRCWAGKPSEDQRRDTPWT